MANQNNNKGGQQQDVNQLLKVRREKLQNLRAIENFKRDNVTVEQGESKKSVVVNNTVEVVNAMSIMYMTTVVK